MKTFLTAILLITLNLTIHPAYSVDFVFENQKDESGEDYSYFVKYSEWRFSQGEKKVIFVCWENPQERFKSEMLLVKQSINNTWQKYSALTFKGWKKCSSTNAGIRIFINDSGPEVEAFGRHINRIHKGMTLNFLFINWKPDYDVQSNRKKYIVATAVHEFGHALGFAHEQNRPNTPDKCAQKLGQDQPNETELSPYDIESVMNYCNKKYANWGELSNFDILGLQKKYGKPY